MDNMDQGKRPTVAVLEWTEADGRRVAESLARAGVPMDRATDEVRKFVQRVTIEPDFEGLYERLAKKRKAVD